MRQARLLGLPLTLASEVSDIVERIRASWQQERPLLVTFVNPHAWALARRDSSYAGLLDGMDLVLPDGIGVVKVARWLLRLPLQRFSFDASSLYHPVFTELSHQRRRLLVIGAAPGVAQKALSRMTAAYPDITVAGCLDGFVPEAEAVRRIVDAAPDLVLCGMGAPRQERLLLALRQAGFKGVAFTCGGFLDQLAEAESYYPAWVDRHDLRWAWRIRKEPRRLWRRYAVEYQTFIRLSALSLIRGGQATP